MSKESFELGYNIALHAIKDSASSKKTAELILERGLYLPPESTTIRSVTVQLGDKYRNPNLKEELNYYLLNYRHGTDSDGYNVIIKTLDIIENSKGEKLYLGNPYTGRIEEDFASQRTQYNIPTILDMACSGLHRIPAEFIYGYAKPNFEKTKAEITKNPNYYLNLKYNNEERIDRLFDDIKDSLSSVSLEISQKLAQENFDGLSESEELLNRFKRQDLLEIIMKAKEQYGLNN